MMRRIIITAFILTIAFPVSYASEAVINELLRGRWEILIREAKRWTETDPENSDPYYFLQLAYYSTNRMDEANASHAVIQRHYDGGVTIRETAEMILRENFENPYALMLMEYVHYYAGEYDDMKVLLEKVIEIKPEYGPAYHDLAVAYDYTGDKEKSLDILLEGINQAPDFLGNYMYAGINYKHFENITEFENIIKKGIEKNADAGYLTAYFHHQLGIHLMEQEGYGKAVSVFEEGLSLHPDMHLLGILIGDAYYRSGNYKEAAEAYDKVEDYASSSDELIQGTLINRREMLENISGGVELER